MLKVSRRGSGSAGQVWGLVGIQRLALSLAVAGTLLSLTVASRAGPRLELSFEHAKTLGINDMNAPHRLLTLVGGAHVIGGGYYGATLELPKGTSTLSVRAEPAQYYSLWVRPAPTNTGTTSGHLVEVEGVFRIDLAAGVLALSVLNASGATVNTTTSGHAIPQGFWTQIFVRLVSSPTAPVTEAQVLTRTQSGSVLEPGTKTLVAVHDPLGPGIAEPTTVFGGAGYVGLMDELKTGDIGGWYDEGDVLFDIIPDDCASPDLTCTETVLVAGVTGLTDGSAGYDVPVRFKVVRDPSVCNTTTPCPVVFTISGGGLCNNDYEPRHIVEDLSRNGLVVVAVDPSCFSGFPWSYNQQVQQMLAAKQQVFASPALMAFISADGAGDYAARGCSHGGGVVRAWLMSGWTTDRPRRTWTEGGSGVWHCLSHQTTDAGEPGIYDQSRLLVNGTICQVPEDPNNLGHHDESSPLIESCVIPNWSPAEIGLADATLVEGGYEYMHLSGGGPKVDSKASCETNGEPGGGEYFEGNTEGMRLMRDRWKSFPGGAETGYFWEFSKCVHCPYHKEYPDPDFARCGSCFLKYGRSGMGAHLPECLGCESKPEGRPVTPSLSCWDDLGPGGAGAGGTGSTAGTGGKDSSGAGSGADNGAGCGCSSPGHAPGPGAILAIGMLIGWCRSFFTRWRRRAA